MLRCNTDRVECEGGQLLPREVTLGVRVAMPVSMSPVTTAFIPEQRERLGIEAHAVQQQSLRGQVTSVHD